MSAHNETAKRALRDLKDQIAHEQDASNLQELVIEINILLDLIDEQVKKLSRRRPPLSN